MHERVRLSWIQRPVHSQANLRQIQIAAAVFDSWTAKGARIEQLAERCSRVTGTDLLASTSTERTDASAPALRARSHSERDGLCCV